MGGILGCIPELSFFHCVFVCVPCLGHYTANGNTAMDRSSQLAPGPKAVTASSEQ